MKLTWQLHAPARPSSIAVPPIPSLIDWYALGYDPDSKRVLYVCRPDDDERGAELWGFDGQAWTKITKSRVQTGGDHIECGGYDTARKAMVAWGFDYDYETEREHVKGTLVTADGATPLAMEGELPLVEPADEEHSIGTFEKHGVLVFDPDRQTWVCLTRNGIWELGTNSTWVHRSKGEIVPQEWHDKTGDGTWDPVGKRAVFWMQTREDDYPIAVLTWNGATLERLSIEGLPDMDRDPIAQLCGHDEHGIMLHVSGQLFAVTSSGWRELPAAKNPPPTMEDACMAYDPSRKVLVLGPGKHEGAGGSNRNDVFFVLRDGAWEQQGVVVKYSPLKDASYGHARVAHVNGQWYGTGTHSLRTWKFENNTWREIVDKKTGEEVGGWEILQLHGGDQLHAVLKNGSVFVLDGERWNRIGKKDDAFKERTEFAIATMPDGRLVVWGGENPRKLNDTLFFENKAWRTVKKSSPKPPDFEHGRKDGCYVGTSAIYDTTLGAVVRFGYEGVAVLGDDEQWTLYTPKNYKKSLSERLWGHVPVHDPETGETLLIDFAGNERELWDKAVPRLVRFDLARCVEMGTIEYPPEMAKKKQHDAATYHAFKEAFSYDPTTRSLYAQILENDAGVYRLDLAPAFAEAKGLGPRTLPTSGAKPVKAAKAEKAEKKKPAKKR